MRRVPATRKMRFGGTVMAECSRRAELSGSEDPLREARSGSALSRSRDRALGMRRGSRPRRLKICGIAP